VHCSILCVHASNTTRSLDRLHRCCRRCSPEHPPLLLLGRAFAGASLDFADDVLLPHLLPAFRMEVEVDGAVAGAARLLQDGLGATGVLADVGRGIVYGVAGHQPARVHGVVPSNLAHRELGALAVGAL